MELRQRRKEPRKDVDDEVEDTRPLFVVTEGDYLSKHYLWRDTIVKQKIPYKYTFAFLGEEDRIIKMVQSGYEELPSYGIIMAIFSGSEGKLGSQLKCPIQYHPNQVLIDASDKRQIEIMFKLLNRKHKKS
jgi:hypothetical protein